MSEPHLARRHTSGALTNPRRATPWLFALLVLLALSVACGANGQNPPAATTAPGSTEAGSTEVGSTEAAPAATPTDTTAESSTDEFPVEIAHKFGATTIEARPQRVVSIGYSDQDDLLALGVMPVAVRYWFGDTENVIFPWAAPSWTGPEPVILNMPWGDLNYEQILALDPDLIVAVSSGITEDEYTLLSQIAPTLAQSGEYDDFGMPWQEKTRLIARAVGETARAETAIAAVESSFADVIAANPAFAGKSVVVVTGRSADGTYAVFSPQDSRTRYFTDLGFVSPAELVDVIGTSFFAPISEERIDLFDRDLIVFTQANYLADGADTILNDPFLNRLDAMKEGRFVILSEDVDAAFSFSSVLSLPFVNESLAPALAEALAGG